MPADNPAARDGRRRLVLILGLVLLGAGPDLPSAAEQAPQAAPKPRDPAPYLRTIEGLRKTDYQSVEPTETPARLTVADLRRGQLAWRAKVQSLRVKFAYKYNNLLLTPQDRDRQARGEFNDSGEVFRVDYASHGPKTYVGYTDLRPRRATGPAAAPAPPAPKAPDKADMIQAFDTNDTRMFEPEVANGYIRPGLFHAIDSNAIYYTDTIGWPRDMGNHEEYLKCSYYIPWLLESRDMRVLPHLESVDGFPCHVATNGLETLWIDDAHGFAVRRRVRFLQYAADDPGELGQIAISKDLKEVAPGVWLPYLCHHIDYASRLEPPSFRGKVHSVNTMTVDSLEVNTVPDSLFSLKFPPGTQVCDYVRSKFYVIPKGEELLEQAIRSGQTFIDGKFIKESPTHTRIPLITLLAANAVAFVALVLYTWRRKRSAPRGGAGAVVAGP